MYLDYWGNYSFYNIYPVYFEMTQSLSKQIIPIQTKLQLSQNHQKNIQKQITQPKTKQLINLSKEDLTKAGYQTIKKLWTQEQDQILLQLIDIKKISWKQIQKYLPQRTQKMCYSRYRRLISHTKQIWTKEQDDKIKFLVQLHGQNWKNFTSHFQNRSSKQIKQRYTNYLRPEIKRDQWTIQQDLKVIELINKHGKKWKEIQKQFGNRTDNQIKNRFYGRLKILYRNKLAKERRRKSILTTRE